MFVVPRNTSVIVKRSPARPGKGTAQRYVLGVLPTDGKGAGGFGMKASPAPPPGGQSGAQFNPGRNMVLNAQRPQQPKPPQPFGSEQPAENNEPKDDSEEARINAFYEQESSQWGATQERLAE